jgi:large subunit ribosomal protein L3
MPTIRKPRYGSLQFWPKTKAKRIYARIRNLPFSDKPGLLGFAGYKAGMTHVLAQDTSKTSITKSENVAIPVTIVECPTIRIAGCRLYKKPYLYLNPAKDIFFKVDKELSRKTKTKPSSPDQLEKINPDEYEKITAILYTQPKLVALNKKKPEMFEMELGGSVKEQLDWVKANYNKEVSVKDVFEEGQMLDVRAITKGKGYQGPVKRWGIGLKSHKSEKSRRMPGSLGPWKGQKNIMWRVAFAGQTGFFQRTEHNKLILKIGDKPEEINQKGGLHKYGIIKNTYVLVKGSIPGPKKRLIMLTKQLRPKQAPLPHIQYISKESKQAR